MKVVNGDITEEEIRTPRVSLAPITPELFEDGDLKQFLNATTIYISSLTIN
jgi:hypothetical protein